MTLQTCSALAILLAFRGRVNVLGSLPLPTNAGQHNPIMAATDGVPFLLILPILVSTIRLRPLLLAN